ncbi:MAG: hypothetical protein R3C32_04560 [Chloroflexota bacterium]
MTLILFFVILRAALPRVRIDQLMGFRLSGWCPRRCSTSSSRRLPSSCSTSSGGR